MPALPLTPSQLEDAARLKALLKQWQLARKTEGTPASQEAIASMLGFSTQSSVSQYANGKIPLNVNALTKFSDLLGCQPEDISPDLAAEMKRIAGAIAARSPAEGPGSSERQRPDRLASRLPALPVSSENEHVAIPLKKVRIRAGVAGFSLDQTGNDTMGAIYVSRKWLDKRGYIAERLFATRVGGLSMSPRIDEGDTVLINTADTDRRAGRVYGFNHEGQFVLKRLERKLNHWYLTSDNPDKKAYPPIMADGGTFMIGRAVLLQAEEL